jgi:hypothetical protein
MRRMYRFPWRTLSSYDAHSSIASLLQSGIHLHGARRREGNKEIRVGSTKDNRTWNKTIITISESKYQVPQDY